MSGILGAIMSDICDLGQNLLVTILNQTLSLRCRFMQHANLTLSIPILYHIA